MKALSNNFNGGSRQKGLTLIELMISLSIAAIVLAGIYAVYQGTTNDQSTTTEIRSAQAIASKIRNIFPNGRNNYSGLSNQMVINAQGFPANMNTSGTTVYNTWAGTVTVAANAAPGFDITYGSVPKYACQPFVAGAEVGFYAIKIGTTTVKTSGGVLDMTAVGTACAGTAPFTIVFSGN